MLRNIPISITLPVLFFIMSFSALGMMGVSSYVGARSILHGESHDTITALSQRRAQEIEAWYDTILAEVAFQASSPNTAIALRVFSAGWKAFDDTAQSELTRIFVTENPNPETARAALITPKDRSAYVRGHTRFHPFYQGLAERAGFADIYLFDTFGNLVYSVDKRADFARNIAQSPDSPLSRTVQGLIDAAPSDQAGFVDYLPYAPAGGALSAFAVQTVLAADGTPAGYFAVRLSTAPIEDIMARTAGAGTAGDAFVMGGADKILSTDADILALPPLVDDTALRRALAGTASVAETTRGEARISGFQPVNIDGVNWITVVETTQDDAFRLAAKLRRDQIMQGAALLAVLAMLGLVLGRRISRPLTRLSTAIKAIGDGDYTVDVPCAARGDEIGAISKALTRLQTDLIAAEEINADSKFQSAAVGATSAALMMTDKNFCVTHMNQSIINLVRSYADEIRKIAPDFDPDDCVGKNMDVFHRDPKSIRARVGMTPKERFTAAIPLGDVRLAIDVQPFFDEQGEVLGSVVEWSDATEETRRNAIVEAIECSQVFAEFNEDGVLKNANDRFVAASGLSLEAMRGRKMADVFVKTTDEDPDGAQDDTAARIRNGETVAGRFRLNPDDRSPSFSVLEGSISPILTRVGSCTGFVLIGNDVTEDQAYRIKVETARAKMQAAQAHMVEQIGIAMQTLAQGDLTVRLNNAFAHEYEQLRTDFNGAVADLAKALKLAAEESINIQSESAEISSTADDMATRTEQQASTLRDTATALDEMTSNVERAAQGAIRTETVVSEARTRAKRSEKVVGEAVAAMSQIESSSQEIVKVISVIDEIAFQTNLLALNAGVEAARAGDAGRGFSVVATEVRALAQRCSDAAGEINTLLKGSGEHVQKGVTLVGETGAALTHIMESVSEISNYISDVAQSGREQSAGLQQINAAVMEIDQTTQATAAMFEETSSASHALADRSQTLAQTFATFKLGQEGRGRSMVASKVGLKPVSSTARPPAVQPTSRSNAVLRQAPAGTTARASTTPPKAKPASNTPPHNAPPAPAPRAATGAETKGDTTWTTDRRIENRRVVVDRRSGAVTAATAENIDQSWEEF